MKIQLDRDVLAEAVAWVARSLPSRPSVPILAGMMLSAEGSHVVLSAFDYETSAKITVPGQVEEEGQALVSGRLLADICRSLPHKPVRLTAEGPAMQLVCGSARFTLQTLPVAEYPELPEMPESTGTMSAEAFAQAVGQVVVAAGRDELLPVFTGVRVEIDGDAVSMLATDRYRMALKELSWNPVSTQAEGVALIPARVLAESAKSMTSGEMVTLSLASATSGEGLIGLKGTGLAGEREVTTRLLDGEFPKVRHLMDVNPSVSVRCNTTDLLAAVKRIALVAERNTPMRMTVHEDHITLDAAAGDTAQGTEAMEAAVTRHSDDGLDAAGFNPHYLQDALQALDSPYVDFSFTAPGKPCLMQPVADLDADAADDYRHVIMLMRLPS